MKKFSYYTALITIFIILIFSVTASAVYLELNDRGKTITEVQKMLDKLGYNISIDGVYGHRTKSVIKSFQLNNGLSVDGVVGDNTYHLLEKMTTDIEYTVKKGDTLFDLADEYDTTISHLKEKNNIRSDIIRPGQKLYIAKTGKGGGREEKLYNNIIHEVEPGDALSLIARRYGTDVETIKLANKLNNDRIVVGDDLVIPHLSSGTGRSFKLARGAFIWPVMGRISSRFGWRTHPIRSKKEFHSGLDIAVPLGKEIRAAASGKVIQSGWISGFGKTIIIEHGNSVQTLYAHNSRLIIRKGTKVKIGELIALAGSTGLSTGSHLHFGILVNDNPRDPLKYLP